jgi:Putative DNA-binding domain
VPALRELQRSFGGALFGGPLPMEIDAELLGIYRNTCHGTLAAALSLSFPAVHRLVGAAFFDACAQAFIPLHPPRRAYLNDYGREFPAFLGSYAPAAALSYLPEVAGLEWAVNRALHAPDVAALDVAALSAIDAKDVPTLRFLPHPAVSVLHVALPADAIWRAVLDHDEAAMAAIDPAAGPAWLLIQRPTGGVEVQRMSERSGRFARRLCAGETLQAALDAEADREDAAAELNAALADHLASGRFTGWQLSPSQNSTEGEVP